MRATWGKPFVLVLAIGLAGSAILTGCSDDGPHGVFAGGAPGFSGSQGVPTAGMSASGNAAGGRSSGGAPEGGAPEGGAAGASEGGAAGASEGGAPDAPPAKCPARVNNVIGTNKLCSAAYAIDECGGNCAQITTDACRACELADTSSCYDDGDNTDGSSLLNMAAALEFYGGANGAARVSAGIAAEACMYRTGCAKAAGQIFTTCYCGTSGAACTGPGAANGPCKAELEKALEATEPLDIASHFGDPTFPGGIAQIRLACDKTQCAAACLH